MLKLLSPLLALLLSTAACKTNSSENSSSTVSSDAQSSSWITVAQLQAQKMDPQKIYVYKFGMSTCIPCLGLARDLPIITKSISPDRFVFIDVDIKKEEHGLNVLKKWINEQPTLRDDLKNSRGDFKNGITVPWVIAVDSEYRPLTYLPGYNTSPNALDSERARYKAGMEAAVAKLNERLQQVK